MLSFRFCCFLSLLSLVFSKTYLYNTKITNEQYKKFKKLTEIYAIDVWKDGIPIDKSFDFLIHQKVKDKVENSLEILNIPYQIQKNFNLEDLMKKEKENLYSNETDFFKKYHTLSEYEIWLNTIVNSYPDLAEKMIIGKSYENRDIFGIKITKKTNYIKSSIVITSGLHAREWAGITSSFWMIYDLLTNSNSTTQFLLETIEWHIIPIMNPDGFTYSVTTNRLWRKSRSPNSGSGCIGTDLNRNWNYQWNSGGSSTDPCSELYRGSSADSEIEVKAIINYISSLSNVKFYLDIHAYSQLLMRPYGYSKSVPPDETELTLINTKMSQNITSTFSKFYQPGRISVVIYEASGSGVDWCYGKNGIFSFAAEVRPQFSEEGGFLLPADQIIATGQEMMNGVIEMAKFIINKTDNIIPNISSPSISKSPISSLQTPINSNSNPSTNSSSTLTICFILLYLSIFIALN
eukprot:gene4286-7622_t